MLGVESCFQFINNMMFCELLYAKAGSKLHLLISTTTRAH